MAELPAGLLVHALDLIMAGVMVEAGLLLRDHRRHGRGLPARLLLPHLGAGLALMLALRLALAQVAWPWIAACVAASGLAHGLDLWALRAAWRDSKRATPPQA
ncbi:MAG: hypothetical protein RL722_133 [Pseudomonadota bacterium]|jgi:hypothetical protein